MLVPLIDEEGKFTTISYKDFARSNLKSKAFSTDVGEEGKPYHVYTIQSIISFDVDKYIDEVIEEKTEEKTEDEKSE